LVGIFPGRRVVRLVRRSKNGLWTCPESGDVTHTAQNKTDAPMVHVLFEILPVDVKGPSIMPAKKS